jgi:hypothetical protein
MSSRDFRDWQRHRKGHEDRERATRWQCCKCNEILTFALYASCITCEHKRGSCCQAIEFARRRVSNSTTGSRATSAQGPALKSRDSGADEQHAERLLIDQMVLLSPTPCPFKRPGRLLDLPILIEECEHLAVPDTGSSINAITYAAVSGLNSHEVIALEDDSAKPESFKLGDGRTINAIGQIWLRCAFPKATGGGQIPNVRFRVYDTLAMGVSVIIGKPFLDATQTLTKYSDRLKERCLLLGHRLPRVMRLRPCKTYMRIYVNSLEAYAYIDTGSELNLVSLDYATKRALEIHNINLSERYVAFADGKIGNLCGKVRIKFELRPRSKTCPVDLGDADQDDTGLTKRVSQLRIDVKNPKEQSSLTDFYVFDGLDCDVLLGQVLLDAVDAFNSHQDAFVRMEVEEHKQRMCGIFKVGKSLGLLKRRSQGDNITGSVPGKSPYSPQPLRKDEITHVQNSKRRRPSRSDRQNRSMRNYQTR